MSFTDKFDLEEIAYGTTGWNAILTANNDKIDAGLDSRLPVLTAGEDLAQYEAVYIESDGKVYRARADGTHQPCRGLAVDNASAAGSVRVRREGEIKNVSWNWTDVGEAIYLSPGVWGGLTQDPPSNNVQPIGYALNAATLVIEREPVTNTATVTTTTTTTTSSTTTTTNTASTTTTTTSSTTTTTP